MSFRPATLEDLDELERLERRGYIGIYEDHGYDRKELTRAVNLGRLEVLPYPCYILRPEDPAPFLEDKLIGSLLIRHLKASSAIDGITIDPRFRKQGLGRKLLQHGIELAREHDSACVTLYCAIRRAATVKFYESEGFKVVRQEEDWYGRNWDAVFMKKMLDNHERYC